MLTPFVTVVGTVVILTDCVGSDMFSCDRYPNVISNKLKM